MSRNRIDKFGDVFFRKAVGHREKATATRCLKRVQTPEDLVGTMVYLCSSDSDFMTGETVIIDGGNVMI